MFEIISADIPVQLLTNDNLKASHLLIYGFLFRNRDENNRCYVTNQQLANLFNYELRKVIRILNTLKEEKLIIRDQSKRKEILINLDIVSNMTVSTVPNLSLNTVKNVSKESVLMSKMSTNTVKSDIKNKDVIHIDINNNSININKKGLGDVSTSQLYRENSICKDPFEENFENSEQFTLTPLSAAKPVKRSKTFSAPVEEEVAAFMLTYAKKNVEKYRELFLVDTKREATEFIEFYESKGWYVGKNKMKNWQLAASRWLRTTADAIKAGRKAGRDLSDAEYAAYYNPEMCDTEQQLSGFETALDVDAAVSDLTNDFSKMRGFGVELSDLHGETLEEFKARQAREEAEFWAKEKAKNE